MCQLSRLVTMSCDYAIIIQIHRAYFSSPKERRTLVRVEADINLKPPETFSSYTGCSTVLFTPAFEISADGFCDINSTLCYFVSKGELERLQRHDAILRLKLKQYSGPNAVNKVSQSDTFDFDLSNAVDWVDSGNKGRLSRFNRYLNDNECWYEPFTLQSARHQTTLPKLQAGMFVVKMTNDTQQGTLNMNVASLIKANLSSSLSSNEQQSINVNEPNSRHLERKCLSKSNRKTNSHQRRPLQINTTTTIEKYTSYSKHSHYRRWYRDRQASILNFDFAEVYKIIEANDLQEVLPTPYTSPYKKGPHASAPNAHTLAQEPAQARPELEMGIDDLEDILGPKTPSTPALINAWPESTTAAKRAKTPTLISRSSDTVGKWAKL